MIQKSKANVRRASLPRSVVLAAFSNERTEMSNLCKAELNDDSCASRKDAQLQLQKETYARGRNNPLLLGCCLAVMAGGCWVVLQEGPSVCVS